MCRVVVEHLEQLVILLLVGEVFIYDLQGRSVNIVILVLLELFQIV